MVLDQIFEKFNSLKALIIGDVMVDAYIWGSVDRISPEAPVPVVKVNKRDYRLGGAANVALNVQALGSEPILCAVIGNDQAGVQFLSRLDERNIADTGIITTERPTTIKTRVITSHQHVVRIDEEEDAPLDSVLEEELVRRVFNLLPNADVVIFEDYDKGCITENVILQVVQKAKSLNIPTIVDPKKRNFSKYNGVSLFKPNLKELREGLQVNVDGADQNSVEQSVAKLIKSLNIGGALITLSERGVYIDMANEQHLIPAHLREISDVSGAGDTVISIAALCLAMGLEPYFIAALSNLGGGLVCEHLGVVPVDKSALLREAKKAKLDIKK